MVPLEFYAFRGPMQLMNFEQHWQDEPTSPAQDEVSSSAQEVTESQDSNGSSVVFSYDDASSEENANPQEAEEAPSSPRHSDSETLELPGDRSIDDQLAHKRRRDDDASSESQQEEEVGSQCESESEDEKDRVLTQNRVPTQNIF